MCLYSNTSKPKIATKDIVCYKVVKCCDSDFWTGIFFDRFKFPYDFVHAVGIKSIESNRFGDFYSIGGGFIHAKTSYIGAENLLASFHKGPYKIVKCIIPKGNEYYISPSKIEICSPSMIIYKDSDLYDKNEKCKKSAIIYFKTMLDKFSKLINKLFA